MSKTENHVPTLNSMGYMTKHIDPYCEEFILSCKKADHPIVDLGVAFGHTTKKILEQGVTVYANDLSAEHLDQLVSDLDPDTCRRLKTFPGRLPDVFKFEENSLSGVLASRFYHFLKGDEIEELTKKIYKSLVPGGMFCVVGETPYMMHTKMFIPTFEERKASGELWPGVIDGFRELTKRENAADWLNLLDPYILERTLKTSGFNIKKVGFINRHYFPKEVRLDGRESAGIIGIKP